MIKLFKRTDTDFASLGLGILHDAISCIVTEELNGKFELEMEYPISGSHYKDIELKNIIFTKPNMFDNAQPFRIYEIEKPINGVVTVRAEHISYDLSGYPVPKLDTSEQEDGINEIQNKVEAAFKSLVKNNILKSMPFTFETDKTSTNEMVALKPSNVRSLLAGSEESIVNVYGGELKFDGFKVKLLESRGSDKGYSIVYSKNMVDLDHEINGSKLYTGAYPFYSNEESVTESGEKLNYVKAYVISGQQPFVKGWLTNIPPDAATGGGIASTIVKSLPTGNFFDTLDIPLIIATKENDTFTDANDVKRSYNVLNQIFALKTNNTEEDLPLSYTFADGSIYNITVAPNEKYFKRIDTEFKHCFVDETRSEFSREWLREMSGGKLVTVYPEDGKFYQIWSEGPYEHYVYMWRESKGAYFQVGATNQKCYIRNKNCYIREGAVEYSPDWLSNTRDGLPLVPNKDTLYKIADSSKSLLDVYYWDEDNNRYVQTDILHFNGENLFSQGSPTSEPIKPKDSTTYIIDNVDLGYDDGGTRTSAKYSTFVWNSTTNEYVKISGSRVYGPTVKTISTSTRQVQKMANAAGGIIYLGFMNTYIVGEEFSSGWLSELPNGTPLTPEKDIPYRILSPGDYNYRTYYWNGTKYVSAESSESPVVNNIYPLDMTEEFDDFPEDDYGYEAYVVAGTEPFEKTWLSLTQGGEPLTPISNVPYKILTSGEYVNKIFYWIDDKFVDSEDDKAIAVKNVYTSDSTDENVKIVRTKEEKILQKAIKYLEKSDIGKITETTKVTFIRLSDSEEYKQFKELENVQLGDVVHVRHEALKVNVKQKIIATEYNVLTNAYNSVDMGQIKDTIVNNIVCRNDPISVMANDAGYTTDMKVNSIIAEKITAQYLKAVNAELTDAQIAQLMAGNIQVTGEINVKSGSIEIQNDDETKVFSVDENGNLFANSATIEGKITAKEGNIGGCEIIDGILQVNSASVQYLDIGKGTFKVDSEGNVTITKGSINIGSGNFEVDSDGNVTAKSGKFGDAEINDSGILMIKSINITSTNADGKTINFTVDEKGNLICNSATIGGVLIVGEDGKLTLPAANIKGPLTIGQLPDDVATQEDLPSDSDYVTAVKTAVDNEESDIRSSIVTIADGQIKAAEISADKITSGTLDASQITVTNLNADNITSGTLTASSIKYGDGTDFWLNAADGTLVAMKANLSGTMTVIGEGPVLDKYDSLSNEWESFETFQKSIYDSGNLTFELYSDKDYSQVFSTINISSSGFEYKTTTDGVNNEINFTLEDELRRISGLTVSSKSLDFGDLFGQTLGSKTSIITGGKVAFYSEYDEYIQGGNKLTINIGNNNSKGIITGTLYGTWNLNSSTTITSDKNAKHNIEEMDDRYSSLFDNLKPVRFKYNDGTSDRYHTGFIAQDIQQSLKDTDMSEKEFAALCGNEETGMGVRYSELHALEVKEIQDLKARVKELEALVEKLLNK